MNIPRRREYKRNYLYHHKKMGLCVHCDNIALSGSLLCRQHSACPEGYSPTARKNRNAALHCPTCAVPLIDKDGITCLDCQMRNEGQSAAGYKTLGVLYSG